MSLYAWVITVDHIKEEDAKEGTNFNAVGMLGPYGAKETREHIIENGKKFSMYDDDKNLYYEGYIVGDYDGFEPLDDFGEPNAGCTLIKLSGRWL